MQLPELPAGWRWERYENAVNYYATDDEVRIGANNSSVFVTLRCNGGEIAGDMIFNRIPLPLLALVLKANGVTL
jgi:hypothetical protein